MSEVLYRNYFETKLIEINQLIEQDLINVANDEYIKLLGFFTDSRFNVDAEVKKDVYMSYAYFLYALGQYDGFLNMLMNAQREGFVTGELETAIYDSFVQPNIFEFKENYEYNINVLCNQLEKEDVPSFSELIYWLVPTEIKGVFYLYNRVTKQLIERTSYNSINDNITTKIVNTFSDYTYSIEGNILQIFSYLKSDKKNYLIISNVELFYASLQGCELVNSYDQNLLIFKDIQSLENKILESDVYLPYNIISSSSNSFNDQIQNVYDRIHRIRLSAKSNRTNILLSVCIPSFNRGKRAYDNIQRLCELKYNNEIEFVISNNGTENETKVFYDKIKEIPDSRLTYFEFETNQGFALNLCKVCEVASGKYLLLLSDEDYINFEILDEIMSELRRSEDISIYRTSTTTQSKVANGSFAGGINALKAYMLTSNYLSGIILNNHLMQELQAIQYIKNNLDNFTCAAYPHMCWELLLLQYGQVRGTDKVLIDEGTNEEIESLYTEKLRSLSIPIYATVESRLIQHDGFFEIFKSLELFNKDSLNRKIMYNLLAMKTLYLVKLSIDVFYEKDGKYNLKELLEEARDYCLKDEFFQGNKKEIQEDKEIISNYYESLLATL